MNPAGSISIAMMVYGLFSTTYFAIYSHCYVYFSPHLSSLKYYQLHLLLSSMAVPVQGNEIARRVVDDLIEFNGQRSVDGYMNFFKAQQISELRRFVNRMREEVQTCRNQTAHLNALIAEMEAFDDPGEVFDTLMGLRDDVRVEDAELMGLNDLIAQAKEESEMKEAQLEVANG
ncbi:hypothetical protein Tco_1423686 [Tanacetum coccineum]